MVSDSNVVSFAGQAKKLDEESDVQEIVNAIIDCTDLYEINLEGNTLGVNAAKAIGKALESRPTLNIGHLKDLFTGRLKTEIPDAIRYLTGGIVLSNAKLTELDLSDNAFGPIGVKAVVPFLQSNSCKQLKILRLNNNGLGIDGGKLLANALKDLKSLEVFICGRNRLENDGAMAFGIALSQVTTLKQLELPQNGIRAPGMEALTKAIKINKDLKILNLNDNTMSTKGGESIALAIKQLNCIEVINFGDCLLRTEGCKTLLNVLKETNLINKVKELTLNGNELNGKELVNLFISIFSTLNSDNEDKLKLNLSSNNFGEDCCKLIEEKISQNVELIIEDDEGSDIEEEEGEDHEEEEDEDEEEEEENNENNDDDVDEKNKLKSDNKNEDDIDKLIANIENVSLDKLCKEFVDLSIKEFDLKNENLPSATIKKTEKLFQEINKQYESYEVANSLLVNMGLLKGEEKNKKNVDLRGPFIALSNTVKYLDKPQKDVFQLFIGQPRSISDKTGKIKHKLMQQLFTS